MIEHTRREVLSRTAGALGAMGAIAGCNQMAQSQGGNIGIEDGSFDTCNLDVSSGSSVAWENGSDTTYTLVSASDNWSIEAEIPAGGAANHQFTSEGVYVAELQETGATMKIAVGSADIEDPVNC